MPALIRFPTVLLAILLGAVPATGRSTGLADRDGFVTIRDREQLKVNLANGNLTVAANDLQVAGPGISLGVTRFFNNLWDVSRRLRSPSRPFRIMVIVVGLVFDRLDVGMALQLGREIEKLLSL